MRTAIYTRKQVLCDIPQRLRYPQRDGRTPKVCMYHGVSRMATQTWGPWQYSITPATFRKHISWLSENRNIISVNSLIEYITEGSTIPVNAVVLTFDDGYQNFSEQALPILQEYDAHSTVYVSTKLMREQIAPYEFRLAMTIDQRDRLTIELADGNWTYDLTTDTDKISAYEEIRQTIKNTPSAQRESLLNQINAHNASDFRIMSPTAVRDLGNHLGVTVGSHGHVHRPLGTLAANDIRENVRKSRTYLAELLDQPPVHFSYPYGSHSQAARRVLEDLGFKSAVTTNSRSVKPRDWNRPYRLPRVDMSAPEPLDKL